MRVCVSVESWILWGSFTAQFWEESVLYGRLKMSAEPGVLVFDSKFEGHGIMWDIFGCTRCALRDRIDKMVMSYFPSLRPREAEFSSVMSYMRIHLSSP